MPFTPWLMVCMPCRRPSVQDTRYNLGMCLYVDAATVRNTFCVTAGFVWGNASHRRTQTVGLSHENKFHRRIGRDHSLRPEWRFAWQVRGNVIWGGREAAEAWTHALSPTGTKSWTSSSSARTSTHTSTWEAGIREAYEWMTRKSGVTAARSSSLSALSPAKRDRSKYGPL